MSGIDGIKTTAQELSNALEVMAGQQGVEQGVDQLHLYMIDDGKGGKNLIALTQTQAKAFGEAFGKEKSINPLSTQQIVALANKLLQRQGKSSNTDAALNLAHNVSKLLISSGLNTLKSKEINEFFKLKFNIQKASITELLENHKLGALEKDKNWLISLQAMKPEIFKGINASKLEFLLELAKSRKYVPLTPKEALALANFLPTLPDLPPLPTSLDPLKKNEFVARQQKMKSMVSDCNKCLKWAENFKATSYQQRLSTAEMTLKSAQPQGQKSQLTTDMVRSATLRSLTQAESEKCKKAAELPSDVSERENLQEGTPPSEEGRPRSGGIKTKSKGVNKDGFIVAKCFAEDFHRSQRRLEASVNDGVKETPCHSVTPGNISGAHTTLRDALGEKNQKWLLPLEALNSQLSNGSASGSKLDRLGEPLEQGNLNSKVQWDPYKNVIHKDAAGNVTHIDFSLSWRTQLVLDQEHFDPSKPGSRKTITSTTLVDDVAHGELSVTLKVDAEGNPIISSLHNECDFT